MDDPVSFGRWLQWRRRTLDLTQDSLARRVGCSVATIRKLEADERRPSRQIAVRLADGLEIAGPDQAPFLALARAEPFLDMPSSPSTYPSGRPPPRPSSNLPAPLTRLIGRKQDVAAVRNVLGRGDTRLLTLIGPPGVGKTRLGIQVAAELREAFADGVCFVKLAPISDPALVITTIAQTLGVEATSSQLLVAQLATYLHTKRLLLLLDNFEHLAAAAPDVAALLEACPGVTVLATSRVALHVRGERLVLVPPLMMPNLTRLPDVATLERTPTVMLFVERAQDIMPDFVLTEMNASTIAVICARLDGLPLAIELAAAHVKLFPPEVLLVRLEHCLTFLINGPRDLPVRQQTLRTTIDWSYNLLNAREQTLFRRLGVFVGGCTLAATAICAATAGEAHDLPLDPLDDIAALVDKSLLQWDAQVESEPRLAMLETIREYALKRLVECGEEVTIRQRHAAWFLALAERADPEMRGAEQKEWFDRLEREHNNLRAALEWSRSAPGGAELGVRLTGALGWFWFTHGNYSEARTWLEVAVACNTGAASRSTVMAQAKVHLWAGAFARDQDDYVRATTLLQTSVALYREAGNRTGLAEALVELGWMACIQGDYERASEFEEQGLVLYREQGHTWGIANSLWSLGHVALDQGDTILAATRYQEALRLYRALGARDDIAWSLVSLGQLAYEQGEVGQAIHLVEESVVLFRELGNRNGVAGALCARGRFALTQGDMAQATTCFVESLVLFAGVLGKKGAASACLEGLARAAAAQAQPKRAARLFGAAEALREQIATPRSLATHTPYDHDVAGVQAQLEAMSFGAAWAEGRALSLEQAIAEALHNGE